MADLRFERTENDPTRILELLKTTPYEKFRSPNFPR